MLTQEQLKQHLHYCPSTGVFTRIKCPQRKDLINSVAGTRGYQGYIAISLCGKRHQAHRLAWLYTYGVWPLQDIDHINDDKSDNRVTNLREASRSQNMLAIPKPINNSSGFKGVSFDKRRDKWEAYCTINRKRKHLGRFDTPEQAHSAYKAFVTTQTTEYYHA